MASLASLPIEIATLILDALSSSHECPACAQNDLFALTLVSRSVSAIATQQLYSAITLRPHDTATYESRISVLKNTLASQPVLASYVRRLRFSHELAETTRANWPSVVTLTPNLSVLQGVDTFFPEVDSDEEDAGDGTLDGNVGALCALPRLSQAVIHHEVMPCAVSTLLRSWQSLKTLVIGNIATSYDHDDADCSFSDLSYGLQSCTKLRNIYFHDCDLEWSSTEERRAGVWSSLPPLERLGIEYSLGESFSLPAITEWLSSGRRIAETLHTLDFHRQLRSGGGVREFAELLAVAKGLKRVSISLTWTAKDEPDSMGVVFRSSTLQEMRFVVSYMKVSGRQSGAGGEEEFEEVMMRSLKTPGALPELRMLTVGGSEGKFETLRKVKDLVVVVEEPEDEGLERLAGLKRGAVKAMRCEVGDATGEPTTSTPEPQNGEQEDQKEGLELVEELWDEQGDLIELWCA